MKKMIVCGCVFCLAPIGFGFGPVSVNDPVIRMLEKRVIALEKVCGLRKLTPDEEKMVDELKEEEKEREAIIEKAKIIDSRTDDFLKEYFGVEIGESYSSITNKASKIDKGRVLIPAIKKFGLFQSANCSFTENKLTSLYFVSAYSENSTDEDFKKQYKQLLDFLGVGSQEYWCPRDPAYPPRDPACHIEGWGGRVHYWENYKNIDIFA